MNYDPAEFDDEGNWLGTCPECGTNHHGLPPDTVGGAIQCARARAGALGALHLVDQADALQHDLDTRRDSLLRDQGFIP